MATNQDLQSNLETTYPLVLRTNFQVDNPIPELVGEHANSHSSLPHDEVAARSSVFYNQDLMEIIFSYVHDPARPRRPAGALTLPSTSQNILAASIACKPFFDPAMNILWRTLESIIPLLSLISGFMKVGEVYLATQKVHKIDCERLYKYSKRVRTLRILEFNENVGGSVFEDIVKLNRHCTLFPTLTALWIKTLKHIPNNSLRGLILFLARTFTISTLGLQGITAPTEGAVATLLQSISPKTLALRILLLHGEPICISFNQSTSFKCLKGLFIQCPALSVELHEGLSQLPFLECLHLKIIGNCGQLPNANSPKPTLHLNLLRYLVVWGNTVNIFNVLRSLRAAHSLHSLEIGFIQHSIPNNLNVMAGACIQLCSALTPELHRFSISMPMITPPNRIPIFPRWQSAFSLYHVNHFLKKLAIATFDWSDNDLIHFCGNGQWQSLTSLDLVPCHRDDRVLSILALGLLAKHCPNLHFLSLAFDMHLPPDMILALHDATNLTSNSAAGGNHVLNHIDLHQVYDSPRMSDTQRAIRASNMTSFTASLFVDYLLCLYRNIRLARFNCPSDVPWFAEIRKMVEVRLGSNVVIYSLPEDRTEA